MIANNEGILCIPEKAMGWEEAYFLVLQVYVYVVV